MEDKLRDQEFITHPETGVTVKNNLYGLSPEQRSEKIKMELEVARKRARERAIDRELESEYWGDDIFDEYRTNDD